MLPLRLLTTIIALAESAAYFEEKGESFRILEPTTSSRRSKRSINGSPAVDERIAYILEKIDTDNDRYLSQDEISEFIRAKSYEQHQRKHQELCGCSFAQSPANNSISFDLVFVAKHGLPALNAFRNTQSLSQDLEDVVAQRFRTDTKQLAIELRRKEVALWNFLLEHHNRTRFTCDLVPEMMWPSDYEHCRTFLTERLIKSLNFTELYEGVVLANCGPKHSHSHCVEALKNEYFPDIETKIRRNTRLFMFQIDKNDDGRISVQELIDKLDFVEKLLFRSFGKTLQIIRSNNNEGRRSKRSAQQVREIDTDMFGPNNRLVLAIGQGY